MTTVSSAVSNQVWLITGAGRGIGLQAARAALKAGHRVVASARSLAQLQSAFADADQDRLALVQLDVADENSAIAAVAAAVGRFGRIDVLLNNAAYGQLGNFEEVTPADVEQQFAVNVFGVMHVLRAALPVMRRQRAGHVINISSVAGVIGFDGAAVYCATKYAVEGLTASLAIELEKFGIAVTAVEPGFFRTDFLDASSVRYAASAIDDYAANGSVADAYGAYHGKQLGDPAKLGDVLVALAAMPAPPRQLLAGSDALAMTTASLDARRTVMLAHAALSASTDHAS